MTNLTTQNVRCKGLCCGTILFQLLATVLILTKYQAVACWKILQFVVLSQYMCMKWKDILTRKLFGNTMEGFSNVTQCRFAGTKILREIQNFIENGSIFINTYWVDLGYSNVTQCRFAGLKTIKKWKILSRMAQYW